jgi:tetratricopeptide (TPR) repeat protein
VLTRFMPRSLLATVSILALGLGANSSAFAQAGPQVGDCSGKNGQISKKISKQMNAAIESLKGQRWQEVLDKTREAQAEPSPKNPYDEYWIHNLAGKAHTGLKQYREATTEFEIIKDTPCMTEPERGDFLKLLTKIYYQLDDYPKVIETGTRSLAIAPEADLSLIVGQAYYITKDFENARKVMDGVVAKLEAEGKAPDEQTLRLIHGSCISLRDDACATTQYEKLVKFYPKPEYWQNLVNTLFNDKKSTDKHQVNVMRLAMHVNAINEPSKFEEVAQISLDQGLPGEAQALIEDAMNRKLFTDPRIAERNKGLLARAKTAAAGDKATLAQQETAAKANAVGNADVKVGAAYLSYGDNAKAIEALQRGISKGGVRDPDEAGILLGIAYLRSGNKPEAAKAFGTVSKDPTMTRIARLWLLNT